MPTTTHLDFTAGVREIGARTDSAGTGVPDLPLEQDAMINAILTEGFLTTDAFVVVSENPASMNVVVGSGTAKADVFVVETDEVGRHPYLVRLDDVSITVTLDAADASNPRIDEIWLVVRDPALSGDAGSLALPRIGYRKGDAAATPAAPGPDSGWAAAVLLASISVGAGVTEVGAGDITDERANAQLVGAVQGAGSGLDADTVDGVEATDFALVAGDTFTGAVTFQDLATFADGVDLTHGATAAAVPSSYPSGMSFDTAVASADGFPLSVGARGLIVTVRGASFAMQWLISDSTDGTLLVRQGDVSADTWEDWSTVTSAENPGLWEVDGLTEVATATAGTIFATIATVNLTIPSDWNTWKCYANATGALHPDSANFPVDYRLVIDGTNQQTVDDIGATSTRHGSFAVVGRRTGMSTTGSRSITLEARDGSGSQGDMRDIALYARAVRTS